MKRAVTKEEITLAFKLFLNRTPPPERLEALHARKMTLAMLRHMMLSSEEFARVYPVDRKTQPAPAREDGHPTVVHLHVPKTAGTSLNRKLLPLYERSERLDAHGGDPTTILQAMDPDARAAIRLVAGHCAHGLHRILTPPVQYLCILREPGPRILSYYHFIMRSKVPPNWQAMVDKRPDFGSFLVMSQEIPQLWNELDNGQVRRLAGRMNAPQVDQSLFETACTNLVAEDMLFGLTETFPDFLRQLAARNILPDTENLRANSAPESADFERAREDLTAEQADLLERFIAWDDRLYDHARQTLASRQETPE